MLKLHRTHTLGCFHYYLISFASRTFASEAFCAAMSPNIRVIPNDKLHKSEPDPRWFGNAANPGYNPHWTNENWLKSRFHFSFAEYHNPSNSDFGVLRVMNDDLVQPARGFGTHPHRDMEIITYIVHGKLTHKDTLGTSETLGRGAIQFMTAGKGIQHSESNEDETKPLRFIQTWINPSGYGLPPNYGSCQGTTAKVNEVQHLVSNVKDTSTSTPVEIHQDVDAHACELELGKSVVHELPKGRQAYLLCIEGSLSVNDQNLSKYDACEITGGGPLEIKATETEATENGDLAHFLMFSMKEAPGAGRSDF